MTETPRSATNQKRGGATNGGPVHVSRVRWTVPAYDRLTGQSARRSARSSKVSVRAAGCLSAEGGQVQRVPLGGSVVEVGAFAVVVEDAEDLGGGVVAAHAVRGHRVEAGGLAARDEQLRLAEAQAHDAENDVAPVASGVGPGLWRVRCSVMRCLTMTRPERLSGRFSIQ